MGNILYGTTVSHQDVLVLPSLFYTGLFDFLKQQCCYKMYSAFSEIIISAVDLDQGIELQLSPNGAELLATS